MIIWDLAAIAASDGVLFSKMINESCCFYLRSKVHCLYQERASVWLRDIRRLASPCLRDRDYKVDLATLLRSDHDGGRRKGGDGTMVQVTASCLGAALHYSIDSSG